MNRSTFRVLVVEDNPGDQDLLEEYLLESDHTWDLTIVGRLADALLRRESGEFDVTLLDLGLPDSQGLETLDRFLEACASIPVVVLTGVSDREVAWEAVESGAHDFLPKDELTPRLLERSLRYAVERARVERELRDEKVQFQTVLDLSVMGIYMLDEDGCFVYANQRCGEIFGLEPGALMGRRAVDFAVEDQREQTKDLIRKRIRGELSTVRYSLRVRRDDGKIVDLEVHGRRVEMDGEPRILGALRDVTEKKALEEQVMRSQKMEAVGRLAGGVAHDFNNLLTTVTGNCALLRQVLEDPESELDYVEDIQRAAERATELTRQLLIFSRRDHARTEAVDLHTAIRNLESVFRGVLGEDVEVELDLRAGSSHVRTTPGHLEQMVLNLALNARDAMNGGGRLWIETTDLPEEARSWDPSVIPDSDASSSIYLRVSDSGAGIPSEILPQIYDPFFTTKDPHENTGLGLSTVYGIVTDADGEISAGPGTLGGAQFTIRLPVTEEPEAESEPEPVPMSAVPGKRILLVEDEKSVRTVVRRILERNHYEVVEVADPREALSRFREAESIDLLLSDVMMPGLHGPEVFRLLREVDPQLRVLFISGYTEEETVEKVGELDARILSKPFNPSELLNAVARALKT